MTKESGLSLTTLFKGIVIALLIVKLFHLEYNKERFAEEATEDMPGWWRGWRLRLIIGIFSFFLGYAYGYARRDRMAQDEENEQRIEEARVEEEVARVEEEARAARTARAEEARVARTARAAKARTAAKARDARMTLAFPPPQNVNQFGKKNKRTRKR